MSTLLTACSGTLIDGNVDPEPSAEPDTPPTLEERLADAPAPVRNCPEQFA